MSLLESASTASRSRACTAARLQSPQDDANANNDAVQTEDDANANDNAVETEDDANANNDAVESVNAANANGDAVAPKDAADARADADYPSGDKISTNTAADRAASISVDNLAAAIVNATNARRPAPTPLYTTVTDVYEASWNLGDTKLDLPLIRQANILGGVVGIERLDEASLEILPKVVV